MKKFWLTLLIVVLVVLVANVSMVLADIAQEYDAAYNAVSDWKIYKGDIAHINVQLVQKTTQVLHNENVEILKRLEEMGERLEKMEVQIADIEDIIDE